MLVVQPPPPSPTHAMLTNAGEDSMSPERAVNSRRDWRMPQLCIAWGMGGARPTGSRGQAHLRKDVFFADPGPNFCRNGWTLITSVQLCTRRRCSICRKALMPWGCVPRKCRRGCTSGIARAGGWATQRGTSTEPSEPSLHVIVCGTSHAPAQ